MAAKTQINEREIGRLLEDAKIVTPEEWQRLVDLAQEKQVDIFEVLEEEKIATLDEVGALLAMQEATTFVELRQHRIDAQAIRAVPADIAREHHIIPITIIEETLVVAMEDPSNFRVIDAVKAAAGMSVEAVKATGKEIEEYLNIYYKSSAEVDEQVSKITEALIKEAAKSKGSTDLVADSPIARTVDMIMIQGIKDKASDVHIEPQEDRLRIRYRLDGILHDVMSLPLDVHLPLVSRLKILAGMNIADRRRPQDGQFSISTDDGTVVDIRAATTDTVHGEKMVMRILDKSFALLDLSELGFMPHDLKRFEKIINVPYGMVLLCGPTGSGKTTTLYSAVNTLNRDERNIMTIEDPVEYRFNDISQINVNVQAGVTFAGGLKALMRLDPDVILVGEIRDGETSAIAVQAALTGHLVLSSVHANDAVAVLYRLQDLGVEPFLLVSSLAGVVAQRMIRRVCTHCKKPTRGKPEEIELYQNELKEKRTKFFYGQGCPQCANTGYRGRTGVHEILVMTEELRAMILAGATAGEIRKQAIAEGMVPMWRNAMLKVKQGITTPYEAIRQVASITEK